MVQLQCVPRSRTLGLVPCPLGVVLVLQLQCVPRPRTPTSCGACRSFSGAAVTTRSKVTYTRHRVMPCRSCFGAAVIMRSQVACCLYPWVRYGFKLPDETRDIHALRCRPSAYCCFCHFRLVMRHALGFLVVGNLIRQRKLNKQPVSWHLKCTRRHAALILLIDGIQEMVYSSLQTPMIKLEQLQW